KRFTSISTDIARKQHCRFCQYQQPSHQPTIAPEINVRPGQPRAIETPLQMTRPNKQKSPGSFAMNKRHMRTLSLLATASVAALVFFTAGCNRKDASKATAPVPPPTVIVAEVD